MYLIDTSHFTVLQSSQKERALQGVKVKPPQLQILFPGSQVKLCVLAGSHVPPHPDYLTKT